MTFLLRPIINNSETERLRTKKCPKKCLRSPPHCSYFNLQSVTSYPKKNDMKKYFVLFLLFFPGTIAFCQNLPSDSGSFFLHKFAQNIGRESYTVTKNGSVLNYDIDFRFTDRGSPVPLKAKMAMTASSEPLSLWIKGSTSRFSTINDSIVINNKKVTIKVDSTTHTEAMKPLTFPIGGYSPGTVQMLLLRYWKAHKQPASITMLPKGTVMIKRDGADTLNFMSNSLMLERYVISGLIWGNEIVWTNKNGKLICLITNDAEGDKLEMMSTAYEDLLPELINRAATYGMRLFSGSMKMDVAKNKVLAIVGGTMIDVTGAATVDNTVIIIENGLIKEVGIVGTEKIPAGATVIHAEGKTIIPGLWDMHSHFEQAEWGPAYLAAGVTTVRDCGNEFGYINSIKSAIDSHKGVGPLILKAGIVDGPGPFGLGVVRATTPEEAIKVVNMYKDNGFVQIKIYSSVKPAIVKVISDEAHRLGLTVTGHIPNGMTTQAGIDSGMDMINHMQYVSAMMKKNKDKSLDLQDSTSIAAFEFLKQHKTVVDPTMGVYEMIFRNTSENILTMEPNFYDLPLPLQILFGTTGMPDAQAKAQAARYKSMFVLVKALHDQGIPIVAGTDMGFPGYSVARELELYVQAGLTPMEALQSATITPAIVMKMDRDYGSVRSGKVADLVILDADPLKDIRNVRKVWKVFKEGEVYEPGVLHRMVGFGN